MKKFLAVLLLLSPMFATAHEQQPGAALPYFTEGMFMEQGTFGTNPKYSENDIELLNHIRQMMEFHEGTQLVDLDPFYFETSELGGGEALNYLAASFFNRLESIEVDPLAFGVSALSLEQGFGEIGVLKTSTDLSGLDAANWATSTPTTVAEAIDRMAALLKTLNTNTAIP